MEKWDANGEEKLIVGVCDVKGKEMREGEF